MMMYRMLESIPNESLISGLTPSIVRHWLMERMAISRTMRLVRFLLTLRLWSSSPLCTNILANRGMKIRHTM